MDKKELTKEELKERLKLFFERVEKVKNKKRQQG